MALSKYDQEYLSAEQQAKVTELTDAATRGEITWEKAHNDVEALRNAAGYSGGADGSGYTETYGGSVYDRQYMSDDELRDVAGARAAAVMGETDWGSAHDYAENYRAGYGYSGGGDGSEYILLDTPQKFTYESAPQYSSKYSTQIDELTQALLGREAFSYDPNSDPLFQQYRETYTREGDRAMQDTIGQVAGRTGGLASSYATTAGAQANNYYMAQLSDKIPELQQLAYSMYMDEYDEQYQNIQLLMALEEGDYNKYLNLLNQYNTDRSFNYQVGRDEIADQRYDTEWNYQVGRDEKNDAQARIDSFLSAGGKVADLDPALVEQSGYTQAELAAVELYYEEQNTPKYTGGGGGGGLGNGGGDKTSGIVETMLSMGNDTAAYEYLLGLGYNNSEQDTLWSLYESAKGGGIGGSGAYNSVLANAKSLGDATQAKSYLERMVDGGYITADEAAYIYQVELGGVTAYEPEESVPTSYEEFYAATGNAGIMTATEFARAKSSGGGRADGYANYRAYLAAMYAKYK